MRRSEEGPATCRALLLFSPFQAALRLGWALRLGLAVLAASVVASAPASAQPAASKEAGGQACAPCFASADSVETVDGVRLSVVTTQAMGLLYTESQCDDEFTLTVNGDGRGWIDGQQFHGPNCHREGCSVNGPSHVQRTRWPIRFQAIRAGLMMEVALCMRSGPVQHPLRCRARLRVDEHPDPHRYRLRTSPGSCASDGLELTGIWQIVGDGFELSGT